MGVQGGKCGEVGQGGQGSGVVILTDVGTLAVVGLLGLKRILLKEMKCFLQVEEAPL